VRSKLNRKIEIEWKRTVLVTTAGTTSAAGTRHRKSNSLRGGGQWQTIALFKLKCSAVTVHLMRTASERGSGLHSVSLMFRLLLRLFDEFSDTFDPVKSSLTSTDVQNECRTYNSSSSLKARTSQPTLTQAYVYRKKRTYLELESNFTDSLTSCRVCLEPEGAALLPPDVAAYDNPAVLRRVPRARYSVLMARPRIVLE
jgi:hypothetical protein